MTRTPVLGESAATTRCTSETWESNVSLRDEQKVERGEAGEWLRVVGGGGGGGGGWSADA